MADSSVPLSSLPDWLTQAGVPLASLLRAANARAAASTHSDELKASTADAFNNAAALSGSGYSDIGQGDFIGGVPKVLMGSAAGFLSPVTGATETLVEKPLTQLTGNPDFGSKAGFLAGIPELSGPAKLAMALGPGVKAASEAAKIAGEGGAAPTGRVTFAGSLPKTQGEVSRFDEYEHPDGRVFNYDVHYDPQGNATISNVKVQKEVNGEEGAYPAHQHLDRSDLQNVMNGIAAQEQQVLGERAAGVHGDAGIPPQAPPPGFTAYHGSPYDFDTFDLSKIGTGEGKQRYGYGLNFTESENLAEGHRYSISRNIDNLVDVAKSHGLDDDAADLLAKRFSAGFGGNSFDEWIDGLKIAANDRYLSPRLKSAAQGILDRRNEALNAVQQMKYPGKTYQVSINADKNNFLDWDKPVNEQSDHVRNILTDLGVRDHLTGEAAYHLLGGGSAASDALRSAGIPGIKYMEKGARATGGPSRSYVVFDDKMVGILKKSEAGKSRDLFAQERVNGSPDREVGEAFAQVPVLRSALAMALAPGVKAASEAAKIAGEGAEAAPAGRVTFAGSLPRTKGETSRFDEYQHPDGRIFNYDVHYDPQGNATIANVKVQKEANGEDGAYPAHQHLDPADLKNVMSGISAQEQQVLGERAAGVHDVSRASLNPMMYNPPSRDIRPFEADYPNGARSDDQGRLTSDASGKPLNPDARWIAGRRVVGGPDQGISGTGPEYDALAKALLGNPAQVVKPSDLPQRSGKPVLGVVSVAPGAARPTGIRLNSQLSPEGATLVYGHELGHVIDEIAGQVSTKGLSGELKGVYNTLNNPNRQYGNASEAANFGKPMTAEAAGYDKHEVPREHIAEAIRAYMTDPNYLKSVAPRTAAAIRAAVNPNPRLRNVVQFNALPLATMLGAGALAGQSGGVPLSSLPPQQQ